MDTSDPTIEFDDNGVCVYCNNFEKNILPDWRYGKDRSAELATILDRIREDGKGRDFDCILGLSGGLDSAYLAHVAVKEFNLRPLLFHVDVGWNTRGSVSNIEKIVDGLGMPLFTEVINWNEMKDLQRSFFISGIPDQDYPQDIAYISMLYKFARQHKIKYILNGGNFSTECCREPEAWGGYLGVDKWLVGSIHGKYGKVPLNTFPLVDIVRYKIFYKYFLGIKSEYLLNYIPYTRELAESTLASLYKCEPFQHKHHESVFTRFYEDYWLPKRFGFEKRRAHFSSLIMTGQMSRAAALDRISKPELSDAQHQKDFEYVAEKLDFSPQGFADIFQGEKRTYRDFRNKRDFIMAGARLLRLLGIERRLF
jgi:N-acetyl sugar amidotransferase